MTSFSILAQAATAAPAGAGNSTAAIIMNIVPLLLIFVVFYFLLIRPQQQRMKAYATKVAGAKRGDTVVTGGGIIGKVTKATDDEVEIEIANGVKVRVVRSTLADVVLPTGKPAND
jgi:preprotein translocase subunit YajC